MTDKTHEWFAFRWHTDDDLEIVCAHLVEKGQRFTNDRCITLCDENLPIVFWHPLLTEMTRRGIGPKCLECQRREKEL